MIDFCHSSGNSSLFQIEKISFGSQGELFYFLPYKILLVFVQYLAICVVLTFQYLSQPQRHSIQGISGSASCISLHLKLLIPCTMISREK